MTQPFLFILLTTLSYIGVYFIRRYAERRQIIRTNAVHTPGPRRAPA